MKVSVQNTSGVDRGTVELNLAYQKNVFDNDQKRIDAQEKLYDYYTGNKDKIEEYLEDVIERTIGNEVIDDDEWVYDWVNLVQKFIKQLAVVYNDPASRTVLINGKEDEDLTKYLKDKLAKVNSRDKKALRLAKLFNTSLTQVTFNRSTGKIDFIIESSHKIKIETSEDDPYKLTKVKYQKYFKNDKGQDELYTVVWTKDEHYKEDASGDRTPVGENKDMVNPFGILVFAKLMIEESEDFWGEGLHDVCNMNEVVNFLLTVLLNDQVVLGGGGTLLAVNLDLQENSEEESGIKKVRTGRRHPIVVENSKVDDQQPDLRYVSTNPLIQEIQNTIDYRIKQIAVLKGLNPNTIISQVKDTSDYQKTMDALDQLEVRRDDIEPCREYEQERFEIIKRVNNAAYNDSELRTRFNLIEIPDNAELSVDFAEIEIEKTPEEKIKERDWYLDKNLISLVDILIEDNPDLTEDEAKDRILQNKRLGFELGNRSTLADRVLNNLGDVNE